MSRDCFEQGTLQAFLDGETAPELSIRITDHVADCDACAMQLAVAEEETALVFNALDRELNSLVPTQRLWSRINESIEAEKSHASIWSRLYALISVYVASPSLTAAAGVLLFVGVAAFVWTSNVNEPAVNEISRVISPRPQVNPVSLPTQAPTSAGDTVVSDLPPVMPERNDTGRVVAMNAGLKSKRGTQAARASYAVDIRPAEAEYIPGEESYIRTITELNDRVQAQKDVVIPVSSRVAFERDMAVVTDAIDRTRKAVRRDPNNQAARQVLYAAYQDKIDLLSSVGGREELMASLR